MTSVFILISDDYLNRLGKFDITIPSRVTREGDHVSYSLHPGHTVRRRSTDFLYPSEDDIIHYKVQVENQDLLLKLKPNYKLTSPSFVIERKKNSFKNVTDSSFKHLDDSYSNCHFHGEVVNQTESRVAVGVCNGLVSSCILPYILQSRKHLEENIDTHERDYLLFCCQGIAKFCTHFMRNEST